MLDDVDGPTSGNQTRKGELHKQIKSLELNEQEFVDFEPIPAEWEEVMEDLEEFLKDFSWDQKMMVYLAILIKTGKCPKAGLEYLKLGKIHHARWMNDGSAYMRLYVSTVDPSQELIWIVTFMVKVFVPCFLFVKKFFRVEFTARCFLYILRHVNLLRPEDRKRCHDVLKFNSFGAHPESEIVGLLADDKESNRIMGVELALQARDCDIIRGFLKEDIPSMAVRTYKKPSEHLNLEAQDLSDLLKDSIWGEMDHGCPALLADYGEAEIRECVVTPLRLPFILPNHTQQVERGIKLLSEVAQQVVGEKARNGVMHARTFDRELMPVYKRNSSYPRFNIFINGFKPFWRTLATTFVIIFLFSLA